MRLPLFLLCLLFGLTVTAQQSSFRTYLIGGKANQETAPDFDRHTLGFFTDYAISLSPKISLITGGGFLAGKQAGYRFVGCPPIINGLKIATVNQQIEYATDSRQLTGRLGTERRFGNFALRGLASPRYEVGNRELTITTTTSLLRQGTGLTITEEVYPLNERIGDENLANTYRRQSWSLAEAVEVDYVFIDRIRVGLGAEQLIVGGEGRLELDCPTCDAIPLPITPIKQRLYLLVGISF